MFLNDNCYYSKNLGEYSLKYVDFFNKLYYNRTCKKNLPFKNFFYITPYLIIYTPLETPGSSPTGCFSIQKQAAGWRSQSLRQLVFYPLIGFTCTIQCFTSLNLFSIVSVSYTHLPGALAKLSHTPMYHLLMVFIKLLSSSFVFRFRFLPDDKWYYIIAIYKCQHLFWIFLKKLFFTFFPPIQRFSCHLRLAYGIMKP